MSAMTDELSYKVAYCQVRAHGGPERSHPAMDADGDRLDRNGLHSAPHGQAHGVPLNLALPDQDWGNGPLVPAQIDPAPEPAEADFSANVRDFRRPGRRE